MACVFCMIANGEIPSKKAYEDDRVCVFYDIDPKAPVHLVAIPKRHIPSAAALTEQDSALVGHLFAVMAKLSQELDMADGFRIVSNCGEQAGQTVPHLHFHLLSGRPMAWPPG